MCRLVDDAYSTIVRAVEGGRGLASQLRRVRATRACRRDGGRERSFGRVAHTAQAAAAGLAAQRRVPREVGRLAGEVGPPRAHRDADVRIELFRSKGLSLVEPESYGEVLRETLTNLQGDTAQGDVARGADFWLSGSHGAAGSFSSNAGVE